MTPDELAQRLTPEAVQAMQRTLLQRVVLDGRRQCQAQHASEDRQPAALHHQRV
jgi:hypothetical protein